MEYRMFFFFFSFKGKKLAAMRTVNIKQAANSKLMTV